MRAATRGLPYLLASAGLVVSAPGSATADAPEVWTTVQHDVTLASESFPDDICGPRAVTETVTNRTQVNHLTAHDDGSFHFVDFETGTVVADYEDPSIPDETFRRTNTEAVNLTPGGSSTVTETLHQSDGTLTIKVTYHLTMVDGEPVVEKEVVLVRGCP